RLAVRIPIHLPPALLTSQREMSRGRLEPETRAALCLEPRKPLRAANLDYCRTSLLAEQAAGPHYGNRRQRTVHVSPPWRPVGGGLRVCVWLCGKPMGRRLHDLT